MTTPTQAPMRATAHGITRVGPAHMEGWHIGDAANEPRSFAQIDAEANAEARAILRGDIPGTEERAGL